ncbi:MAG: hypothetical protein ACFFDH_05415 [Promethearchaeota archaeon]
MTYPSDFRDFSNLDGVQFQKFILLMEKIMTILKKFEDNYDKKLNFSKMLEFLNIPKRYTDQIIEFLLETQYIFENTFRAYRFKKMDKDKSRYLISEKKIPQKISLTQDQLKLLSDLIYTFKKIKRGRGFDLSEENSKFHANMKLLFQNHPYLFETNGNGLIYPSSFGQKLGELIISYSMANKEVKKVYIDNYKIKVKGNE